MAPTMLSHQKGLLSVLVLVFSASHHCTQKRKANKIMPMIPKRWVGVVGVSCTRKKRDVLAAAAPSITITVLNRIRWFCGPKRLILRQESTLFCDWIRLMGNWSCISECTSNKILPKRDKCQNAFGVTDCFFCSVAFHCIKNLKAKAAWAIKPRG